MHADSSGELPRSKRVAKRVTKKLKTDAGNLDNPEESQAVSPDKENISQKPERATRKRRSKLANLPGMPIDVLFEIFGHLHPNDLLKLSRMTKDFRRLLISRSAMSVWKDSLANVPGLPECPPGMTEIAWANLAFSQQCHFCSTSHTRTIEWAFRFRICSKCATKHFEKTRALVRRNIRRTYSESLYANFENLVVQRWDKVGRSICLKSDFHKVLKEYNELPDNNAREEYMANREESILAIFEHAERCQTWEGGQIQGREAELHQLREERLAAIKSKLIALGWEEELAYMSYHNSLSHNKLVNRPQRLTERIWANIKPCIIEHMEGIRSQRIKEERRKLVLKRQNRFIDFFRDFKKSKYAENLLTPRASDFLEFVPIKEIVNMPTEVEVTQSSFDAIIPQFPGLIENWRKHVDGLLSQLLKRKPAFSDPYYQEMSPTEELDDWPRMEAPRDAELSEEELLKKVKLASTVFACAVCDSFNTSYLCDDEDQSGPLFYPHLLGHNCRLFSSYWEEEEEDFYSEVMPTTSKTIVRFRVDTLRTKTAEEIVKLAGLDPMTATADDMDNLNLRFVCNKCPESRYSTVDGVSEDEILPILEWRGAVRHQTDNHSQMAYTVLPRGELSEEVITAENEWKLETNCEWRCVYCADTNSDSRLTLADVKEHLNLWRV